MPKSRGRHPRRTHDKLRSQQRSQQRSGDEARHVRAACMAFDKGDIARALRHLSSVPRLATSSWAEELRELEEAGEKAPGWLWCRATLRQAFRSAVLDGQEQLRAAAVAVVAATYPHHDVDETSVVAMIGKAMAADELVRDSVLFDVGALEHYLHTRASAELMARMPLVSSWPLVQRSVYRLGDLEDDRLWVTDLVTREQHTLLHIGAAVGLDPSACVLGRVAPITEQPGSLLVSRPLHVDDRSATELADAWRRAGAGDGRDPLPVLSDAVASGRMPGAPALAAGSMCLGSDLQPHPEDFDDDPGEPAPRVRELMESGLSMMDAQHVVVVEMALWIAREVPDVLPVVAAHAAIALSHERVRVAVRTSRAAVHAPDWQLIARCVQEPVRGFCLEMGRSDAA